jgi:hypothetical protein
MQTTQASESLNAYSGAFQVGQHDPAGVSDHYVLHVPAPVNKHSDLSINFLRNLG